MPLCLNPLFIGVGLRTMTLAALAALLFVSIPSSSGWVSGRDQNAALAADEAE